MDYFRGDELPAWLAEPELNGDAAVDYGDGWTFTVKLSLGDTVVTKTSGITGFVGSIVVDWDTGELDIRPGEWSAQLTATRFDGSQFTVSDVVRIKPRTLTTA